MTHPAEDLADAIRNGNDLARMLTSVEELCARWHRHEKDHGDFIDGMKTGWVQALALLLGSEARDVLTALREGLL